MQKNSQQDSDGVIWNSTGLRLGEFGMDLRRPSEPPALADLVNARFLDERTIRRRDGHDGAELRDGDVFPTGSLSATQPLWMYSHGQVVGVTPGSPSLAGGMVPILVNSARDATSLWFLPNSSAQWTSLISDIGVAVPTSAWGMQEASGNFADLIASNALTNTGMTHQIPIAGWSRFGAGSTVDNGGEGALNTGGAVGDVGSESGMLLVLVSVAATITIYLASEAIPPIAVCR